MPLDTRRVPSAGNSFDAGWSSPVARQAHNLKVVGSNPTPATNDSIRPSELTFRRPLPFVAGIESRSGAWAKRRMPARSPWRFRPTLDFRCSPGDSSICWIDARIVRRARRPACSSASAASRSATVRRRSRYRRRAACRLVRCGRVGAALQAPPAMLELLHSSEHAGQSDTFLGLSLSPFPHGRGRLMS
jgi:hypothetical protein